MKFTVARLCFILLSLSLPVLAGAQQCWKRQTPYGPLETWHQMIFTTPTDGIVVGDGGNISRTSDSGSTWISLEIPTYNDLNSVAFPSYQMGWAAGASGVLLQTINAGFSWSVQPFADSINIKSVSFRSVDTGYLCGDSCIYHTYNGGASWTRVLPPVTNPYTDLIFIKAFPGKDTVVAYTNNSQLCRSFDNGVTWNVTALGYGNNFSKVDFATPAIGYGVVYGGQADKFYKTTNGGLNWTLVYTANMQSLNTSFGAVQALDANRVFILEPNGSSGVTACYTLNGGQTWSSPAVNNVIYCNALYFTSATKGCVADIYGGLFKTKDGAASYTWSNTPQVGSQNSTYTAGLQGIAFADSLHGIAAGAALSLRTTDGGLNWQNGGIIPNNSFAQKAYMSDAVTGWVVADYHTLYRTQDGGQSYGLVANNCNDVRFFNSTLGVVAGNNGLWRTTNAGTNWTNVYNASLQNNFTAVDFADSLNWYATSSLDSLYQSSDAGITWVKVVGASPGTFQNTLKAFKNGRLYDASGSSLGRSLDTGLTWTSNTPANTILNQPRIAFADSLHGMVTSSQGYGGIFGTPVLLKTNNGALSWQSMPIHSGSSLNDITYPDTAHAWVCTSWGSIYRYYSTCPPSAPLPPFANRSYITSCAGAAQIVTVTNYNLYTAGDTLTAVLKQGNTILQTPGINAQGQISFNAPAANGVYTLEIKVRNAQFPAGVVKFVTVQVIPPSNPYLPYWRSLLPNPSCAPVYFSIGTWGSASLGPGYTLELRMIKKNGTDSLINTTFGQTNFPVLTDSCRFYFKVYLGDGLCYGTTVYFSDTVSVNIVQPRTPSVHLTALPATLTTCAGDSVKIMAHATNLDTSAVFSFHGISGGVDNALQSGPDSVLVLPALNATTVIYAAVQASAAACVTTTSFHSDSVLITVLPLPGLTVHMTTSKVQNAACAGDTLTFKALANLPGQQKQYEFHAIASNGQNTIVQTGPDSNYATIASGPLMVYTVANIPGQPCSIKNSDTVLLTVYPLPVTPAITALNGLLIASPYIAGASYQWYLNGVALSGSHTDTISVTAAGNYTVGSSLFGCSSAISGPYSYVPSAVIGANISGTIRAYPSPVNDVLWIEWSEPLSGIELSSLDGKLIAKMQPAMGSRKTSFSTQGLADGIYLLRVQEADGREHRQLILKGR